MVDRTDDVLNAVRDDASNVDGDATLVDPAGFHRDSGNDTTDNRTTSGRKRRSDAGQPRGSRAGGSGSGTRSRGQTKASLDIDGVSALLVIVHRAIAERSGVTDENGILVWEINDSEGKALATAANNVIRHYDIAASQKIIDIGALVTTAFAVYMPRIGATMEAKNRDMTLAQAAE